MNGWFGTDGKLMQLLDKLGQMVVLSVLWLLGCVLILPAGGATAALYYAVTKSLRLGQGDAIKEFFRSLRANFLRGLAAFGMVVLCVALLALDRNILTHVQGMTLLKAATVLLTVLAVLASVYIFPILSRFRMSVGRALTLAFAMSLRCLPYTLLILAAAVVGALAQIYLLPMATVLLLPALCCYGLSFFVEKALRRYMPPKEENEDAWYYS